jgi:hypothetical protein
LRNPGRVHCSCFGSHNRDSFFFNDTHALKRVTERGWSGHCSRAIMPTLVCWVSDDPFCRRISQGLKSRGYFPANRLVKENQLTEGFHEFEAMYRVMEVSQLSPKKCATTARNFSILPIVRLRSLCCGFSTIIGTCASATTEPAGQEILRKFSNCTEDVVFRADEVGPVGSVVNPGSGRR